eukprot:2880714-Rhodomonas_salina.1
MEIDSKLEALREHVRKKQRVLSVLEKAELDRNKTPGPGRGGGGARGRGAYCGGGSGARGGRGGAAGGGSERNVEWAVCSVCNRKHPCPKGSGPLEENCYQRDITSEHKKLDELKERQRAAAARSRDKEEQCQHHRAQYARQYLEGAAVDSVSPIDIQNDGELANLTCAPNVFLEGIIPGTME